MDWILNTNCFKKNMDIDLRSNPFKYIWIGFLKIQSMPTPSSNSIFCLDILSIIEFTLYNEAS